MQEAIQAKDSVSKIILGDAIMKRQEYVSHEDLLKLLDYNAATGVFRWKSYRGPKAKAGMVGGSLKPDGYIQIRLLNKMYMAQRLAWFYVHAKWPENEIDHINGIKSDNRIVNLRDITASQNSMNIGRRTRNTSGFIGVSKSQAKGRWVSRITVQGKIISLGSYDSKEDAYAAYCEMAKLLHGEFCNVDNNPSFMSEKGMDNG